MSVRQYIGARYVPRFSTVNGGVWDNSYSYEALEIVKYGNDYYTSKIPVPTGVAITNTDYWVLTGNYNGAIAGLDDRLATAENNIININEDIDDINDDVSTLQAKTDYYTPEMFGAKGDGVADDTQAFVDAISAMRSVNKSLMLSGNYIITSDIVVNVSGAVITSIGGNEVRPKLIMTNGARLKFTSIGSTLSNILISGTSTETHEVLVEYDGLDSANPYPPNIDGNILNCTLSSATNLIKVKGRSLKINNTLLSTSRICIDIIPADS